MNLTGLVGVLLFGFILFSMVYIFLTTPTPAIEQYNNLRTFIFRLEEKYPTNNTKIIRSIKKKYKLSNNEAYEVYYNFLISDYQEFKSYFFYSKLYKIY
jgi:hypothetical protein